MSNFCERLECRTLLTAVSWVSATDGLWTDPANWSTGKTPGAADDVTIDVEGNPTITLQGAQTVHSLLNAETLVLQGRNVTGDATLNVAGDATNQGTLRMQTSTGAFQETLTVGGVLTNAEGATIRAVAGTGGDRTITGNVANRGAITAAGYHLSLLGKSNNTLYTLNQLDGVIDGANGAVRWEFGRINLVGGALLGQVEGRNMTLDVADTFGASTLAVTGNSTLVGSDSPLATVWVQGRDGSGDATLTIPGNLTNHGTILLQSIDGQYREIVDISGKLTNAPDGVLRSLPGPAGGEHAFIGNVVNQGVIQSPNYTTEFRQAGAAAHTFDQQDGRIDATPGGFIYLTSGRLNLAGGALVGNIEARNAAIDVAETFGAQTISAVGACTLVANRSPLATIVVLGRDPIGDATLTAAAGAVNAGVIRLSAADSNPHNAKVVTNSAGLVNQATGVIDSAVGTHGGDRVVTGSIINQGRIQAPGYFVNVAGQYEGAGGATAEGVFLVGARVNISAAPSQPSTLVMVGLGGQLLSDIPPNVTLEVLGRDSYGETAVTIPEAVTNRGTIFMTSLFNVHSPVLNAPAGLHNAVSGVVRATSGTGGDRTLNGAVNNAGTLEGNLTLNGSVNNTGAVRGSPLIKGNLINAGLVAPGSPTGTMRVVGAYVQTADGALQLEIDGPTIGNQTSQLQVQGTLSLGGSVSVTLGFSPSLGQTFTIIDNDANDAVDETFNGVPQDGTFVSSGRLFRVNYHGGTGNDVAISAADTGAVVVRRQLFYNDSTFDGNLTAANAADDAAIATDKTPLLPGKTAGFESISSFAKGITGVMIDVSGLAAGTPTLADFALKVGRGGDPATWADAPAPTSLKVRRGAGFNGSDRVTFVWNDDVIVDQWLQVTTHADAGTGLARPDVFYFGNLVGETGDSAMAAVTAADLVRVRNAVGQKAEIDNRFDFNRDGVVNAADLVIVRNRVGDRLPPITTSQGASGAAAIRAAPPTTSFRTSFPPVFSDRSIGVVKKGKANEPAALGE